MTHSSIRKRSAATTSSTPSSLLTDGGADYSFECIGNTKVMRQALECCHKGWGQHHHRRRRGRGRDQHAAVPAGHRRAMEGSAFGGARGRTDVPKIVDWYMDGKINIDDLITHHAARKNQRRLRPDEARREDLS